MASSQLASVAPSLGTPKLTHETLRGFEFEISIDPVFPFQDVLQNLTALNLTESTLTERRATWSPDDSELLYHGRGASGCGDEKRVADEFVIIDSVPAEDCEVILSTKGRKKGISYPHWWPNHAP